MNSNDRFSKEAITINEYFPSLYYEQAENGQEIIKGEIILADELGSILDKYQVKIISSPEYPFRFPYVFETGGRIPVNIDWHVFPNDGHCCIKAIPEEKLICKKGITLSDFISRELIPYFYNQLFREENGYFLNERSHGDRVRYSPLFGQKMGEL